MTNAHDGNNKAADGEANRRLPSLFLRQVRPCGSSSSARWMFFASSSSASSDIPQTRTISDGRPQTECFPTSRAANSPSAPLQQAICELCGKVFFSVKALHGHMRTHDDRPWRGMRPPTLPSSPSLASSYSVVGIAWGSKKSRGKRKRISLPSLEKSEQMESVDFSEMEIQVAEILAAMPETILAREKQRKELEPEATMREKKHVCHICHKSFDTGMALGGHMSGHRLETMHKKKASLMAKASIEVTDEEAMRAKQQDMCETCGMRFCSEQAFGGYMRLHYHETLNSNPSMCSSSLNEMPVSAPKTTAASSSEDTVVAEAGMAVEPTIYISDFDLNELPKSEF